MRLCPSASAFRALGLLAISLVLPSLASGEVVQVNVQNFSFSPRDIVINQGDTVRWVWVSGVHTVTSGIDGTDANGGAFFNHPIDSGASNLQFEFTFSDTTGLINYYCAPHWFFGMTGTVTVNPSGPSAASHTVITRDFEFDPPLLEIAEGDTVRWVWESGAHTTTSGASSNPIHSPGSLWNLPVTSAEPQAEVVFEFGAGTFPYFCMPHEAQDMRGVILVGTSATGIPGDDQGRLREIDLKPPYPNPSAGSTNIQFVLQERTSISVEVFDLAGRQVRTLARGAYPAGEHVVRWEGDDQLGRGVSAGIYFVRFQGGGDPQVRKVFRAEASGHGHHH